MAKVGNEFEKALKNYQKNLNKELSAQWRAGVIQIMGVIVKGSPVLTGRFRGNWLSSTDVPITGYTIDGVNLPAANVSQGVREVNDLNSMYFLTNNLPYAIPLANGYSAQASSGWIDVALLDGRNKLQQAMQRIKVGTN